MLSLVKLAAVLALATGAFISIGPRLPHLEAAASLYLQQRCEPDGTVSLAFVWEYNDPRALQQWLDVSQANNGWPAGTFTAAGPLAGTATQFIWTGWRPNSVYYARVNQQLANGAWDSSITYRVEVQGCGGAAPAQQPVAAPQAAPAQQPATQPSPAAAQQPATQTTQGGTQIVSLSSPINRGNTANLTVKTLPSADCSLSYTVPSGEVSTAQGLGAKSADSGGFVTWNWLIGGNTGPGAGTVRVTCAGQTASATIQITG